jgi:Coatomer WD associated region
MGSLTRGTLPRAASSTGWHMLLQVDASEFMFKQALARRDFDAVLRLIRSNKLCGTAIIAFLRKKGFPEVALHFVKDDRARFDIAIECGNIEVALQARATHRDARALHMRSLSCDLLDMIIRPASDMLSTML